jgi:hypothetical protein
MPRIIKIVLATLLVVVAAFLVRAYYLSRTRSAVISGETQRGLKRIDEQADPRSNSPVRTVE